jgi:hypothetical protein
MVRRLCVVIATVLAACDPFYECAAPATRHVEALPALLSETGLYRDGALAEEVLAFAPRYELWSDGAEKKRFVLLPPGQTLDVSDADDWRFPEGTKIWKEFSRHGVKLETRLIQKLGPRDEDWTALSYAWREDGSDADAVVHGALDVLGTSHDVPAAGECWACHGPRRSFVLGLSYVQLAYDAQGTSLDMERLVELRLLSKPLPVDLALPGDERVQSGLGYLHANCGHCHNRSRASDGSGQRCYDPENDLDFWLRADRLKRVDETPTYRSAVGSAIAPGRPQQSRVLQVMKRRALFGQMPPLGTNQVDERGVADVRSFIEALR